MSESSSSKAQENQPRLDLLLPPDIARACEGLGEKKAGMPVLTMLALAVLAGAFIALGAMLFTVVITDPGMGFGPSRLLGGVAFSLGLILVILAGAELFTGNTLVVMGWASRRVSTGLLLKGWMLVFVGNFVGAVITALLVYSTDQWQLSGAGVGGKALEIAAAKSGYGFWQAFALGVLCNALVTLAVWLSLGARDFTGKALAIVFPITAFVAAGFEHSVANMYFIPLGMLLEGDQSAVAASGLTAPELDLIGWNNFLLGNLVPVTLGNLVGGGVLVGLTYWLIYLRDDPRSRFAAVAKWVQRGN